jgi:hypothetical protein
MYVKVGKKKRFVFENLERRVAFYNSGKINTAPNVLESSQCLFSYNALPNNKCRGKFLGNPSTVLTRINFLCNNFFLRYLVRKTDLKTIYV